MKFLDIEKKGIKLDELNLLLEQKLAEDDNFIFIDNLKTLQRGNEVIPFGVGLINRQKNYVTGKIFDDLRDKTIVTLCKQDIIFKRNLRSGLKKSINHPYLIHKAINDIVEKSGIINSDIKVEKRPKRLMIPLALPSNDCKKIHYSWLIIEQKNNHSVNYKLHNVPSNAEYSQIKDIFKTLYKDNINIMGDLQQKRSPNLSGIVLVNSVEYIKDDKFNKFDNISFYQTEKDIVEARNDADESKASKTVSSAFSSFKPKNFLDKNGNLVTDQIKMTNGIFGKKYEIDFNIKKNKRNALIQNLTFYLITPIITIGVILGIIFAGANPLVGIVIGACTYFTLRLASSMVLGNIFGKNLGYKKKENINYKSKYSNKFTRFCAQARDKVFSYNKLTANQSWYNYLTDNDISKDRELKK